MKSLNNEKLIINLPTKIYLKSKILKEIKFYLTEYKNLNALIVIDNYIYENKNKLNYILKSFSFIKNLEIVVNNYSEPTFENLRTVKSRI